MPSNSDVSGFPRQLNFACRQPLPWNTVLRMQEREVELNKLKEESVTLKREAAEAKEKEVTWATKHEALDRNFRQVSIVSDW